MAWAGPRSADPRAGHHGRIDRSWLPAGCEDEDWETEPDSVPDAPRRDEGWGEGGRPRSHRSAASVISDLSRSLRDCELSCSRAGKPGTPPGPGGGTRGHPPVLPSGAVPWSRGPDPPPGRAAHTAIERVSVFERNVAEKLDSFFYAKLQAGERGPGPSPGGASGTYENLDEAPGRIGASGAGARARQRGLDPSSTRPWPRPGRWGPEPGQPTPSTSHGTNAPSCDCCQRERRLEPVGWREPREAPGTQAAPPAPGAGSSEPGVGACPRLLPRCMLAHLQSCPACQRLNQHRGALPGPGAPSKDAWSPRVLEQDEESGASRRAPARRPLQKRLSEVRRWLEQMADEEPESPGAPSWAWPDASGPVDRVEAGHRGQLPQPAAAPGGRGLRRRKSSTRHPARHQDPPLPQPGTSPRRDEELPPAVATCSCLFCDHPRGRQGRPSPGVAVQPPAPAGPSAPDVAPQPQVEHHVQRIVAVFERRSRRAARWGEEVPAQRAPEGGTGAAGHSQDRPRGHSEPPREHGDTAPGEERSRSSRKKGETAQRGAERRRGPR